MVARECDTPAAETVTAFLKNYMNINGIPKAFSKANETAFTGGTFAKRCEEEKRNHGRLISYIRHGCTGMVQRSI